jgi:D-alanyl-D-alanine carboxypeptidase
VAVIAGVLGSQLLAPAGARGATRASTVASPVTRSDGTARHQSASARPGATDRGAIDHDLQARLAGRMSRSTAGRYGLVFDVAGVGRVASIHPAGAMRPASTQKLFTTLPLLLDQPGRRLVTSVRVVARPEAGVVHGDLVVHAAADPSLLKFHLTHLAEQVQAAGVRHVTGQLRLDTGSLPMRTRQPGWKPDFVPWDVGPLSPFPVYEDVWRHDSGYLQHPTLANLRLFRARLADQGVSVAGGNEITRSSHARVVVARHQSAPVRDLVRHTLQISDNFYAETLLVVAGGHQRVREVTADAGVTDQSFSTDGSGLSYDDRESPRGEVMLLRYADKGPARNDLRRALPIGCNRNGTLEHRFCGTVGAGKVFAKTGTLDHTTALAGYTTDALGRNVTFSVICAGVRSLTAAMRATDKAVLVLRHYSG